MSDLNQEALAAATDSLRDTYTAGEIGPDDQFRQLAEPTVRAYLAALPSSDLVERLRGIIRDDDDESIAAENYCILVEAAAHIATLEAANRALMDERTNLIQTSREHCDRLEADKAAALARISELEAWKAEAEATLKPFGDYATEIEGNYAMHLGDDLCPAPAFPLRIFRTARRLTSPEEQKNG